MPLPLEMEDEFLDMDAFCLIFFGFEIKRQKQQTHRGPRLASRSETRAP